MKFRYDLDMTKLDASFSTKLALAGLIDVTSGGVDRPVPPGEWLRLPIWGTAKGYLLYGRHPYHFPPGHKSGNPRLPKAKASPGLLNGFVTLAEASDDAIVKFAKRWGPLALCEKHGLPYTHLPVKGKWCGQLKTRVVSFRDEKLGRMVKGEGCRESLASWREYAGQARATLSLAANIHQERLGNLEDWSKFPGYEKVVESIRKSESKKRALRQEQWLLGQVINDWLRWGTVAPKFEWDTDTPRLTLSGTWLAGALALQLAMAVSRTEGLAFCSNCGRGYVPTRRPRVNVRNYCEDCGRSAAMRYASQNYRQSQEKKSQKSDKGKPANNKR